MQWLTIDPVFTRPQVSSGLVIASNRDTRFRVLSKALGLPGLTTEATLTMDPDQPVELVFSAIVNESNCEELSRLTDDNLFSRLGQVVCFTKNLEGLDLQEECNG